MAGTLTLIERMEKSTSPLVKKLFLIMIEKKTNLCIAADGMDLEKVIRLIEKVGEHICILKVHIPQFGWCSEEDIQKLYKLKKQYNFLLFEDCKYFDGGQTIQLNYQCSLGRYFDLITVIPVGDQMFDAVKQGMEYVNLEPDEPRGCLAVCDMSFDYTNTPNPTESLKIAERNSPTCVGIISQRLQVSDKCNMIKATPGVNLKSRSDGFGQQWRTPEEVMRDGSDVIIVGRGITKEPEDQWEPLAKEYKEFCFKCLRA